MKIIYLLLMILFFSSTSMANSCWKIKNKDTKAFCESKFENKQNCWKIKNKDKEAYCEATAYGKANVLENQRKRLTSPL